MSHPAYCNQCGNPLREEDRFCGNCGAAILSPPDQAEQLIPRQKAASIEPASIVERKEHRRLTWVLGMSILAIALIGGGVLAFVGLGTGFGSASPDAPPDPAFGALLPELRGRTDAPIMLPAELPNELEYFGIAENVEGDSYSITFLTTPPEDLVGGWAMAETVGSLEAVPTSESKSDQSFEVVSTEDVRLSDGTEAKLRYMQPVLDTAMFGPRWEGTFDKGGYTYTLSVLVSRDGYVVSKQVLSSMVEVE